MDKLIFDAGQQRWRWGDLKGLRPDLFGHLSAEQLRQRWRNLEKKRNPTQQQQQHQTVPVLQSRGTKRKHSALTVPIERAAVAHTPPSVDHIIDQRVINGVLYFKCETPSGAVWLSESEVNVQSK
jgi:hypothetical protein